MSVSIIRQGDGTYKALVSLDGASVLDAALTLWSGFADGRPSISVGVLYASGPSAPWAVRIDDLTLDLK